MNEWGTPEDNELDSTPFNAIKSLLIGAGIVLTFTGVVVLFGNLITK